MHAMRPNNESDCGAQKYVRRVDVGRGLDLTGSSIRAYQVGEITRYPGQLQCFDVRVQFGGVMDFLSGKG